MLILENNHPPMRKLTQPWKLRRSFGSQPVGNVAGPRWPEAGIAAQELPSESSRRTFRDKVDTHCRPADLPTCRFWSLMTTAVPTRAFFSLPECGRFLGRPTTPVSSFQAPATAQRSFLGTIRHRSSRAISREIARIQAPCRGKHQSSSMPIFQLLGLASSFILKASFPLTAKNQEYLIRW